ncbi:hypothetical protein GA0070606_3281 [Micromonospora citrea]|uniref:Uncharacterized protein n=1 Tax=Micromonospora citrea TaxID=47855 RepID=A0A1C6V2D6_9ACTN|nr:hypothetical protein [Micromonospora citrea]SCL60492.1 hypothetical protein GA0070606_3281 [Micromonospora citrea]
MTARGFGEVDHDLLADYVGGALDGTPDEAVVARLVDEDEAWAAAYALLAPAVAGVRADLAAWAAPAPEMPADVTDRLLAALATAPLPDPGDDPIPAEPGAGTPGGVPTQPLGGTGRRPAGVPRADPGRGGTTGPGRRRRRWSRVAGPVALAAVSIAAVGLGVNQFTREQQADSGVADTAMSRPTNPGPAGPAATPFRAGEPTVRSETDYTPQSLAQLSPTRKAGQFTPGSQPGVQAEGGRLPGSAAGLDRLTDPAALGACIRQIGAEHGSGPLVVDVVEYARFQGLPALVVRFTDAAGARWAWASGPECGVPGSGSDSRYRTRVG